MRSRELLISLRDLFKRELKDFILPSISGEDGKVKVFLHAWPDSQDIDPFPSVVIRWAGSEMTEELEEASIVETIAIGLGVYSEDVHTAGLLLAELNDAVMQILHRPQNRLLAKRFQREWAIEGDQPPPDRKWADYHAATIVTKWQYRVPETPLEFL